jgi:hypothetical protein
MSIAVSLPRFLILGVISALSLAAAVVLPAVASAEPAAHTRQAYDPFTDFTAKWTRADAQQIMGQSDPDVQPGENSMLESLTMPDIPKDFPVMKDKDGKQVWVWDTWPLTDGDANQYSYKGGPSSSRSSRTRTRATASTTGTGIRGSGSGTAARPTTARRGPTAVTSSPTACRRETLSGPDRRGSSRAARSAHSAPPPRGRPRPTRRGS